MVTAIVLINVKRPNLQQVIDDLKGINGVTEILSVTGEYDLTVNIKVPDNVALSHIVADKIHHNKGIAHAKTLIALKSYIND